MDPPPHSNRLKAGPTYGLPLGPLLLLLGSCCERKQTQRRRLVERAWCVLKELTMANNEEPTAAL